MNHKGLISRVYAFCDKHINKGKKFIVDQFKQENVPKTSIYRYICRWEKGISPNRKSGSGRKAAVMNKANIRRLEQQVNNKSGKSTRMLAKKFKCSQSYIVKTLKNKCQMQYRRKIQVPDRSEKQQQQLRPRCRRLMEKFRGKQFILDDESYFTFKHSNKNANVGFYTTDYSTAPEDVKCKKKSKFERKILVWVAISPAGISQPFFQPSRMAINQEVYLNDCIKKRLIPFIKKYHSDDNYVFWPDLASSHYAKSVVSYLTGENITFVDKQDNPPCAPELRPIEQFWSILKGLVYQNGWEAKNEENLKNRIKYCLTKMDLDLVQRMVDSVPKKLDHVRRTGRIN
jgi:hypothetical protein